MAIRITLECGHASMLRVRTTPEGYTHDWEVFVRGVDNADIHHYIEKVVFILHDTFRNPKRVLKEPPFIVKESGYAGFIIPIEIHLKNKDEPKKFQIAYDLHLQPSGPPINNVIRHTELISNPSDEFRRKLLKGGAIVVSNRDSSLEKSDIKTSTMAGKPKLSSNEVKKHRITESKTSNSFHDLFGPPIKTAKVLPDAKKIVQLDKSSVPKALTVTEKSDKIDKTVKLKESPYKDSRKDKLDEKKDKKVKDSSKDKARSKEKSKRPPSPGNKSHSSPVSKRPVSPITKKPLSPLPPTKRPTSPKSKEKELKKIASEKEKDNKEKDKAKNNSKSVVESSKSEKKKDKKKHKEDRDKEKKDKYKETEKASIKDVAKVIEKKSEKSDKAEKLDKEKSQECKSSKDGRKSPKSIKENDKMRDDKVIKIDKGEKSEKSEKMKDGKSDRDRQKHKHKKKDKKDKRDSNKERERKEKREKSRDTNEKQNNVSSVAFGNPLSTLLAEIPERDSSDSAPSLDDESLSETKNIIIARKEAEHMVIPTILVESAKPPSPGVSIEMKREKSDRSRRDKSKRNRSEERESRKRKRRSESKGDDEIVVKRERGHSMSPPLEPVSSSQSPVAVDVNPTLSEKDIKKEIKKEKDDYNVVEQVIKMERDIETDVEQVAPDSTNNTLVDTDISEPPVFSEDYVSQLKDLQQKIMTLQDNQELQRVVQVIAETGQYEITKKTFDFDLCALDRRTVQRLQQFFSAS